MEDRLEQLIQAKTWNELTEEEKKMLAADIASEAEYNAFRKVTLTLAKTSRADINPHPMILKDLKARFRAQHQPSGTFASILLFKVPAYAAIALVAVALSLLWSILRMERNNIQPMAEVIMKTDTVYVKSAPDTVYVNQVVYRYIQRPAPDENLFKIVNQPNENEVGVSMKEKEELENLLVSGSD
jgi:hypothetical protein